MFPLRFFALALAGAVVASASPVFAATPTDAGNRLTYLDSDDPFYPHKDFPKLITPQWVGEPGVEAVVILAIDDMRTNQTAKYELFLRPILERLKKMDGRAPVSIMTCSYGTNDLPQIQSWLKEGLNIDAHTIAHPCPLLQKGSFTNAWNTYHDCVDLLNRIPGNKPVAFRMPCCDSMNSPSPRFYAEIFNRASPNGNFLTIDSSVMCVLTTNDTSLPRELVLDALGRERFRKYFPAQTNAITKKSLANFGTYIEDYPYPYVVNKVCWEFPAMVPSDWEAFNTHGATNATTLADWKAALDAVVRKQGVFTWIFHPHGWSSPAQIIEFIDHAERTHGKKVKFLTFREAQERLDKNLLKGQLLRDGQGGDNGVRVLDLNNDGFIDVVVGNSTTFLTRTWNTHSFTWMETGFPTRLSLSFHMLDDGGAPYVADERVRFGVIRQDGSAMFVGPDLTGHPQMSPMKSWEFKENKWIADTTFSNAIPRDVWLAMLLPTNGFHDLSVLKATRSFGPDRGVRFRDMDHDGICELIVANESQQAVFKWSESERAWKKLDGAWPKGVLLVERGQDNGVRFADVNGDGFEDLLVSNERGFSLYLYINTPKLNLGIPKGWTFKQREGTRIGGTSSASPQSPPSINQPGTRVTRPSETDRDIPPFVRAGEHRNNGAWFHLGQLFVQNEDTAHLPDNVDRRPFKELLVGGEQPPKSPEESLKAFQVRPGFKVELVASEPLVMDPVAFDWGADGKLWVVEMADYPRGIDDHGKPGGRIVFLEDTDGDGKYDKRTVFLDGVNFPNGIMCWRKGVLVSAAPEIFYAEDTDGDGKADVKKVLFTGFREGNQQHRINGFEYGLDGWVYAANGDSGGQIVRVGGVLSGPVTSNSPPIDIRGYDIRFKPDTGEIDLVAGQTQFGRHRDDWGNWFGNNNPNWLWHYHIPIHYLKRNPQLVVKSTRTMLANYTPPNQVFTIGKPQQRFNWPDRINEVTSANSATPYRDDLFGPGFATSVFMSEPANNVVHREVLEPDGVTFKSHREPDEQDREFLASADNWFRPTMLKTGPDGALYIADMYRLIIEHPEYFPEELKNRPDMRDGDDKGRIWRVYPEGKTLRKVPNLAKLNTTKLVAAMDSPNGWQRDVAQRILVDLGDKAAAKLLSELMINSNNPKARLQALCTLDGLKAVTPDVIIQARMDGHQALREHIRRICEPFGKLLPEKYDLNKKDETASLMRAINSLQSVDFEDGPRVAYQLALSLGEWKNGGNPLLDLSRFHVDENPHIQVAVLSSAIPHLDRILAGLFEEGNKQPSQALIEQFIGLAAALGRDAALVKPLERITASSSGKFSSWQISAIASFLDALDRRGTPLSKFQATAGPELKQSLQKLDALFAEARANTSPQFAISNSQFSIPSIRLLGRGPTEQEQDFARLGALLNPQVPPEVQQAALASLKKLASPRVASLLLGKWNELTPTVRSEALAALMGRAEWTQALLAAIEGGKLTTSALGTTQQQQLLTNPSAAVRERAAKLFAVGNPDRQKVVKQYQSALELQGNPARGAQLFGGTCATCHKLRGAGSSVGPDLGTVADKPAASLLVAILDPNQAVDPAYVYYIGVTKDNRDVSGIIVTETPNSVTFRNAGGLEETVLRADLKELRTSGLSLMPEGLEAALNPQAIADIIAFIQSGAPAPARRK